MSDEYVVVDRSAAYSDPGWTVGVEICMPLPACEICGRTMRYVSMGTTEAKQRVVYFDCKESGNRSGGHRWSTALRAEDLPYSPGPMSPGKLEWLRGYRDSLLAQERERVYAMDEAEIDPTKPHPFQGVVMGTADRPCTACKQADRHPIHQGSWAPERMQVPCGCAWTRDTLEAGDRHKCSDDTEYVWAGWAWVRTSVTPDETPNWLHLECGCSWNMAIPEAQEAIEVRKIAVVGFGGTVGAMERARRMGHYKCPTHGWVNENPAAESTSGPVASESASVRGTFAAVWSRYMEGRQMTGTMAAEMDAAIHTEVQRLVSERILAVSASLTAGHDAVVERAIRDERAHWAQVVRDTEARVRAEVEAECERQTADAVREALRSSEREPFAGAILAAIDMLRIGRDMATHMGNHDHAASVDEEMRELARWVSRPPTQD